MKKFILFSIIFISQFSVFSQHCIWDGYYVIMLEIRDYKTNEIIKDLNIYIADSSENPYIIDSTNLSIDKSVNITESDSLKFWLNLNEQNEGYFPFGVGCYFLITSNLTYNKNEKSDNDLIIIKDAKNKYEIQKLKFSVYEIYPLCTNYEIWDNEDIVNNTIILLKIEPKIR